MRTLDRGAQPLRWRAETHVPAARMRTEPQLVPIEIRAGAFGAGCPARDLFVSPQHRIYCNGPSVELMFGLPEGLAAAKHLVDGKAIRAAAPGGGITYHHLLLDRHEILFAEGLATESYRPGPQTAGAIGRRVLRQLAAQHPNLVISGPTARPLLNGVEARVLRAA